MKINIKNIRLKSICATLLISIFLSCNNGIEELEKRNQFLSSLAKLGNDFLSVFTSFGDSLGGVLAFDKTTPKSKVGEYFKNIHDTVKDTKGKLEKLVADMKDKGNPNAESAEAAVKKLISEKLDEMIKGAETISEALKGVDAGELIGNVAAQTQGGVAGDIDNLLNGIKGIVEVVLKEGNSEAGDNNKAEDLAARNNNGAIKLFASDNSEVDESNTKKLAVDASKSVGAVTGADILQAMIKGNGAAVKLAKNNANNASNVDGVSAPKDAEVAGAIALRAMAKSGKFANANNTDTGGVIAATIKGAAISAVTKALDTLTIAIRKTIDTGLKTVKEAMKINPEATPVTTESITVTK
ncbi:variable large family protein (plasmid) [Borrelia coriaceae]|uniref:Variable large protein n=1 Tax=Borrelia coriaceae ATCC 43381 TaxID=1408429 RepID=W5SXN4_9SPIR|nr:variable large family protein [Borrelia coriaceae]AHH11448.1 Variable outer membrane protein [Borrelia coriaceae ATCC 43381]UPA17281.1 variable large family protein [Borrelia coriaceae]